MKTIYFIRHGEGYHNLKNNNRDNYHLLYPRLTTRGINQCFSVKEKKLDVDIIYVSPLRRTLETAEYIFGKKRFIALEDIREFIQNNCDYKESNKEISKMFPYVDFTNSIEKEYIQIEESQDNFNKRTESFYKFLLESPFKKNCSCITWCIFKKFIR